MNSLATDYKVSRSFDYKAIRDVLTHPEIYPLVTDDRSPEVYDFHPPENENIIYLIAEVDGETAGVIVYIPEASVVLDSHIAILPKYRMYSTAIGRMAIAWAFDNTKAVKIEGRIPKCNRKTYKFAKKIGFKSEGVSKLSYLKGGKLFDRYLVGIIKGGS